MSDESSLDRRQFMSVAATTGAAALVASGAAGGQTDAGNNTTTATATDTDTPTTTETGIEYPNATHRGVTTANINNLQFNPLNSTNSPEISQFLLFERFAQYNFEKGDFVPAALTDWEYTGDTFELTLREGMEWSNGDAVTAQDVAIQFKLLLENEERMSRWASSVEAPDDHTVVIGVEGDVNPELLEADAFSGRWLATDRATYQSELEAVQNGDKSISDVVDMEDTDPVTCGPFELEQIGDNLIWCSRTESSPWSSNINFGHYEFGPSGGTQARQQALLNLEVDSDFSVAVPPRVVENFPDAVEEVQYPDVFGVGLTPNHDEQYAGDRAVRKAMAYAINRDLCIENSLPRSKATPEIPTGIASGAQEQWLGDEMSNFESYGRGAKQFENAAQELENNGYSKVDGTWQDPDGETVSIEITVPGGWSDWVLVVETAVAHLNEFGFDASLATTGSYFDVINDGDFQFVANTWLHGGPTTHPYFSLLHQLWEPQLHVAKYNYPPAKPDDTVGGSHDTLTVPARTGSGVMDVDTDALVDELWQATTESEAQELILDLAWAANRDLPMIPLTEKRFQSWLTSDDWDVPTPLQDETEANVAYAQTWLPRKGMLNYDGEPAPERTPIRTQTQTDTRTTIAGPTVDVSAPAELERGESTALPLVLSDRGDGVDSFELTVTTDSDRAIIVDASLPDGVTVDQRTIADDNQSATLAATDDDGVLEPGSGPLTLGEVRVAARETGPATVSVAVDAFAPDVAGETPNGTQATIDLTESSLTEIDFQAPLDLDGDGKHKDLTANGQVDFQDVIQYFSEMQSDSLRDHTAAYDYSGNGEIDYQDLITLFRSI